MPTHILLHPPRKKVVQNSHLMYIPILFTMQTYKHKTLQLMASSVRRFDMKMTLIAV